MKLDLAAGFQRAIATAICGASLCLHAHVPTALAAAVPSDEAQASLRRAFKASSEGILPMADELFTKAIVDWSDQPPDEQAALYKACKICRKKPHRSANTNGLRVQARTTVPIKGGARNQIHAKDQGVGPRLDEGPSRISNTSRKNNHSP